MEAVNIGRDVHFGTYRTVGLSPVDFDEFHREELPRRLAEGVNERVAWDVEGKAPISIGLPDGRAWSYVCEKGRISVVPGVVPEARTVLEIIDDESWLDYLYEFRTRYGLLYSKAVRFLRPEKRGVDSPIRWMRKLFQATIFALRRPRVSASTAACRNAGW